MKTVKKLLAALLALCLAASFFPAAFAVNSDYLVENEDKTFEGDITGEVLWLVDVEASGGESASAIVNGSISNKVEQVSESARAANVYAEVEDATASLTVYGSVRGENSGKSYGMYVNSDSGGASSATVNGNVYAVSTEPDNWSAVAYAAYVEGYEGNADLTVTGNLSATSASGATGLYADAEDNSGYDGSATVKVGGDVTAQGIGGEYGGVFAVEAYSYGDSGYKGDLSIEIGGSVSALGTGDVEGMYIDSGGDARIAVVVKGDVSGTLTGDGEACGVFFNIYEDDDYGVAAADVLVEGTITGSTVPVVVGEFNVNEASKLTVWKIEPNGEGKLVESDTEDHAEDFQKNSILYIIKTQEGVNGVTFTGTEKSHDFDCAREEETVTLNTLPAGATAVYNNGTALSKNADGKYYLVVPAGGGVYLTFDGAAVVVIVADAPANAPANAEGAPGLVTLAKDTKEDGHELRLYNNGKFTTYLPTGEKLRGVYSLNAEGELVLTLGGENFVGVMNEDGSCTFELPMLDGSTVSFTITEAMVAAVLAYLIENT